MKLIIFLILIMSVASIGNSQSFDSLLYTVNKSNPKMLTLNKLLETEYELSKTGLYPENPFFSYGYLFGSPSVTGNQTELEISQSFKLPGYYIAKNAMQVANYEYKASIVEQNKREILYDFSITFFDLVYLIKHSTFLEELVRNSEELIGFLKLNYEKGEISKNVYDNAMINHIALKNEYSDTKSKIKSKKEEMKLMSEFDVESLNYEYPKNWILSNENELKSRIQENNLMLKSAKNLIAESEAKIKFEKINRLPSLMASYKSENILNQKLQGFQLGISIPLWENKNKVSSSSLNNELALLQFNLIEKETNLQIKNLYNEAENKYDAWKNMNDFIENQKISENTVKLFKSGEISLLEFITELKLYIDAMKLYYSTEKEYYMKLAEIKLLIGYGIN